MTKLFAKKSAISTSLIALALALSSQPAIAAHPGHGKAAEAAKKEAEETAQAVATAVKEKAHPWGIENTDLPADSAIRYGKLPNGMRYALRQNGTPEGAAVVRMLVNVGSVAEADNEQGLAHFLEHMAFNGSTNVPEGEMIKLLERQGLAFGPDTNASTSFTQTIYKLDVPDANEEALDLSLMLMRETASNLTISDEAVERERGVIQSERQLRNSPQLRSAVAQWKKQIPDTPVAKRLPIGTVEVVDTAPASRIRDFYRRYYRPENTTLVIVGDVDLNAIETKIMAKFADWQGVGTAGAAMDYGTVDPAIPFSVGSFADPTIQTVAIFQRAEAFEPTPNSVEGNLEGLQLALASKIMADRFQKLALAENSKTLGGASLHSPLENIVTQNQLIAVGKQGDWQGAVAVGEQELRRAVQFGFTQSEFEEQLTNLTADFTNAAKQQETRRSVGLADAILQSSVNDSVVMTPAGRLEVFEKLRPQLTAQSVSDAFRKKWQNGPSNVFVTNSAPIEGGDEAILAALTESQQVAVAAPVEEEIKAFAYDDFGTPGEIVKDGRVEDLGIRTVEFANGVRLNIKQTDFEDDKIRYTVNVGEGLKVLPENSGGIAYFIENVMAVGGLGEHDIQELQKLLVGKTVGLPMAANQNSITSAGTAPTSDAEFQFKLLAALISDPGYRTTADSIWQNALPTIVKQNSATPIATLQSQFRRALASGDPRYGRGTPEELGAASMARVKELIGDQLANGKIHIAIVGDIEEQAAIDIVAKTFGALPARTPADSDAGAIKPITFPKDKDVIELYHDGEADQGFALAVWPTDDDSNQKDSITRSLMATAMGLIVLEEVREKLGASYSVDGFSQASSIYPGDGFVAASSVADPARMDEIFGVIRTVAKQMRDAPISQDVLLRAQKPLTERLETQDTSNGAWIGTALEAQRRPERLDRWRNRKAIAAGVTVADIQAAARKYLVEDALLEMRIVPKPAEQ